MSRPTIATGHAVERYIQRWRPGWTFHEAEIDLHREMSRAVLHETPAGEDPIWRTPRGCLLVVSGDGAVRTVLPQKATAQNRRPRR